MKKFLSEYFYVPKHEKIRDKVIVARMVSTVTIIVISLIAMCIAAYAHFSSNISSGPNIIRPANFATQVKVHITDDNGQIVGNSQITPITSDYKKFRIEGLEVGEYYTITITPTEQNTAKTGFVIITADGCDKTYHTQQLKMDAGSNNDNASSLSFNLMITDSTEVKLITHWGTSTYYDAYRDKGDQEELYITQGEDIKMIINGFTEPNK